MKIISSVIFAASAAWLLATSSAFATSRQIPEPGTLDLLALGTAAAFIVVGLKLLNKIIAGVFWRL